MAAADRIFPGAFLVCVALTACNADRAEGDGYSSSRPDDSAQTVAQPNMPTPQATAQGGPLAKDSAATGPLDAMTPQKENTAMPEALHGNNHSSPSVGSIKKSSAIVPRSPKVIWI